MTRISVSLPTRTGGPQESIPVETGKGNSVRLEYLGAGLFEPYRVNGVVDDAHGIGFRITDVDVGRVFDGTCANAVG